MDARVDPFRQLPVSKYYVPESVVGQMLDIKATNVASVWSKVSDLILVLKGHASGMIELMEQDNELKIHVAMHGQKEAFQTNLLAVKATVNREPRWFSFGLMQMCIKKQSLMMKSITGSKARRMDKAISARST